MATSDATALPIKNTALRIVFPIFDADGDLVTGAAGLDSEVSKDQGTFTDCTNEATEIATASGMYYLDLTSTEMNADCVAVIVKTSTTGAKTTPIVLYTVDVGYDSLPTAASIASAVAAPSSATIAAAAATAVWDKATSSHLTAGTFGAHNQPPETGLAQAGAAGTITLAAAASATTDLYKFIRIVAGTGKGQERTISAYNGTTKVATVTGNWAITPDTTTRYEVFR